MIGRMGAAVVVGLLLIGYFGRLGGYPLQDPDEGRYAEIAREMALSGDWVTPTLHQVKYFDKPPLLYWLVALLFRALSTSEGVARLVPAGAAIVTVGLTFALGRVMFGMRAAWIATLMLATSPLFFLFSQALTTDMLLTACTTATLAVVWGLQGGGQRGRWAVALAGATAFGVLAKGLVALVLPGFIALAFFLMQRDVASIKHALAFRPVALFFAIAIPWFVAVTWASPEFARYFFYTQHVERFTTAAVGHPEGPFFYVPVLIAGTLPWSIVIMVAAWAGPRERRGGLRSPAEVYLLIWASAVLLFFSVARSKLPAYILPAFPALALLAGRFLAEPGRDQNLAWIAKGAMRALFGTGVVLVVAAVSSMPFAALLADAIGRDRGDVDVVLLTSLTAGGGAIVLGAVLRLVWRGFCDTGPRGIAAVAACTGLVLFIAIGVRDVVRTSRTVGETVRSLHAPGDLVISYKSVMHGFPFYADLRAVHAVAFGELQFGADLAVDREDFFWADRDRVLEAWRSGRRVFLLTRRKSEAELLSLLEPRPEVLLRDGDRLVLVNFGGSESGEEPNDRRRPQPGLADAREESSGAKTAPSAACQARSGCAVRRTTDHHAVEVR